MHECMIAWLVSAVQTLQMMVHFASGIASMAISKAGKHSNVFIQKLRHKINAVQCMDDVVACSS